LPLQHATAAVEKHHLHVGEFIGDEFTISSNKTHLHFQLLFKRTVCTNSKSIQTVNKNSWQLPKIKRIMQKTNPVKVVVENACMCLKNNVDLVQKSSTPNSFPNSFALQKTSLQINFSSKNMHITRIFTVL
jgi:hypothetical protein